MLDNESNDTPTEDNEAARTSPGPEAAPPADTPPDTPGATTDPLAPKRARKAPAKKTAKKPAAKRTTAKKAAAQAPDPSVAPTDAQAESQPTAGDQAAVTAVAADAPVGDAALEGAPAEKPKKKAAARKRPAKAASPLPEATEEGAARDAQGDALTEAPAAAAPMVLFQAPEPTAPARKRTSKKAAATPSEETGPTAEAETGAEEDAAAKAGARRDGQGAKGGKGKGGKGKGGRGQGAQAAEPDETDQSAPTPETGTEPEAGDEEREDSEETSEGEGGARRRRRRGGRRRRKPSDSEGTGDGAEDENGDDQAEGEEAEDAESEGAGSRRRRRRRRPADDGDGSEDSENGANRSRKQRSPEDEITSIGGSTRLEAKKQRRREGREAGRRRAPIVSEAEFLARRESVDRVMVIRQKDDLTQIGVLEDKVLVEHYVARESQTSLIGNVYLGRVQNVLPSMEAAFIDIGKGRNAVLYAGEVNWAALGHKEGQPRKIESVLSAGQTILVQVTKDPVGHKGARLTGQISLPGRFLVYVPEGNTSGISRKLPDTERNRLKTLLKKIVPEQAGVIVRTAAEGASEEELTVDVERLTARWTDIEGKVKDGKSPQLLYGEPDLTLKVVRDLFTEDFAKLVVQGDDAWDLVDGYVSHVAPDLRNRLERFDPAENGQESKRDLFAAYRVDEQIAKGLDRKVWLPSGGSLVIDRTEAMTVVDVNTGKFTGSGGNLEETVTKNNLEAAEEIVRQLRLRDIGGIIVVDFIDMVLESNRDLVLRRLVECLGRDRTRHQVAEVTSLGLVQMTRKRIGTGLLEAFSTDCEHCKGRGLVVHEHPVEPSARSEEDDQRGRRGRSGRNRGRATGGSGDGGARGGAPGGGAAAVPSPADLANSRPPAKQPEEEPAAEGEAEQTVVGKPTPVTPEPQHVPSESASPDGAGRQAAEPAEPAATPYESTRETAPEPAVPETPRVVTSTRRRTARRPAGPPSAVASTGTSAGPGDQAPPSAEPVDVPVEPAGPDQAPPTSGAAQAPGAVEAPGGTGSSDQSSDPLDTPAPLAAPDPRAADEGAGGIHADPTWPTAGDTPERTDQTDQDEPGEQTDEGDHEDGSTGFSLLHVPIKRKGSRKR